MVHTPPAGSTIPAMLMIMLSIVHTRQSIIDIIDTAGLGKKKCDPRFSFLVSCGRCFLFRSRDFAKED